MERLGAGKRAAVTVTVGHHTYRSTVTAYRGAFMLPVSAENREAAGISAGEQVDVELELDSAPREVTLPADFAGALDSDPTLRGRFEQLAFTYRKEHVRAIEAAKTPQTRQRRIAKALETLREASS